MQTRSHARSKKAAHINISLTKEELAELDALAQKEGRNRSNMFRQIVKSYMKPQEGAPPFPAKAENSTARTRLIKLYEADPEIRAAIDGIVAVTSEMKAAEHEAPAYTAKAASQ